MLACDLIQEPQTGIAMGTSFYSEALGLAEDQCHRGHLVQVFWYSWLHKASRKI